MFGIGFTELITVALVVYLVLGPKRLFRLSRELGYYWQKMQATLTQWKSEINQVIQVDEKAYRATDQKPQARKTNEEE